MNTVIARARSLGTKIGIGAAVGVAAVLVAAGSASAHVKVSGTDTTPGGYGVLSFRVPTESATASTVGLTVTFPSATPIVSADTQPMPGWTATVATKRLAHAENTDDGSVDTYVSSVSWKADAPSDGVPPGEFQIFNVSVGALPETTSVAFPSLQTYSDGSTVDWNETASGGAEPEHPSPVLTMTSAGGSGGAGAASDAPSVSASAGASGSSGGSSASAGSAASASASGAAAWPGIVGLVAGVLGLVAGLIALARTYRKPTPRQ